MMDLKDILSYERVSYMVNFYTKMLKSVMRMKEPLTIGTEINDTIIQQILDANIFIL